MLKDILVVCTGNICRSPVAEFLLRDRLGDRGLTISSAGLAAREDHPMSAESQQHLATRHVDGRAHRARALTLAMIRHADLVLVMETRQRDAIESLAPDARGKVLMLSKWHDGEDIPDPWRRSPLFHEHAFRRIDIAVSSWVDHL